LREFRERLFFFVKKKQKTFASLAIKSAFFVSVAYAVQGFELVEGFVHLAELLA
jgi:hypothetical protein